MEYLGLTGDDTYDDYDLSQEYERPLRGRGGVDPTGGRGRGYAPEYVDDISRPAPRPMRDDSMPIRRPDDSGLQVRPVGAPRTSTVRAVPSAADHFKEGQPVIVNLEGADREMSRRIIDFASGLCYGLGGTMEKVGSGVYLLKPTSYSSDRH